MDLTIIIFLIVFTIAMALFIANMLIIIIGAPFIPYIIAKVLSRDIMLIFRKNGSLVIEQAIYNSSTYSIPGKQWVFIKKDNSIMRFGDLQCAVAVDNWGITIDPRLIMTIQELRSMGYDTYEQLISQWRKETELLKSGNYKESDIILHGASIRCNSFDIINFERVYDYSSRYSPSQVSATIDDKLTWLIRKYQQSQSVPESKPLPLAMIFIITALLLIGMVAAKSMGWF